MQMDLIMHAKVVSVESQELFADGRERVRILVDGGDHMKNELRIPNTFNWHLNQRLAMTITAEGASS